ncbi:MAG: 3-phosphoshikimate 1-carboxyvinyltransferase [Microthrixaceae bacterium]
MSDDGPRADPLPIHPLTGPPVATVALPGSKSITNRALVCAALADGTSVLRGALVSDDTGAMLSCLSSLGVNATIDSLADDADGGGATITVPGADGPPRTDGAVLDARSSGTTSRFVAPLCAAAGVTVVLDGSEQLRARPMGDMWDSLETLGASLDPLGEPGHLPVQLSGPPGGIRRRGGEVRGDASSQFLSGLLLAAPVMPKGLELTVTTELVSAPYVEMTLRVMEAFGARVERSDGLHRIVVLPGGYMARDYSIEPDASAASYFFALASVSDGEVTVPGLSSTSLQGDLRFVEVLAAMGAQVEVGESATVVRGTGRIEGVDVDMSDISDTAQTLAAIAALASTASEVRGVGFIRHKETDRIGAVVRELDRLGIEAAETEDGFTVKPGMPAPAVVQTYDDHRMAMSFAVLGLMAEGVSIADPGCVAKTFPGFWEAIERLRAGNAPGADGGGNRRADA